MKLHLQHKAEDHCHISMEGSLTQVELDHNDPLVELIGEANFNRTIYFCLKDAVFIDSSGIGWLLSSHKKIRSAGGKLVLHSVPENIGQVFSMMRLHSVLSISEGQPAIGEHGNGN